MLVVKEIAVFQASAGRHIRQVLRDSTAVCAASSPGRMSVERGREAEAFQHGRAVFRPAHLLFAFHACHAI